ncbi:MAG: ADP-ribosylglycohydrolase family protein [Deltaproteobacteria bacterium]|nr:ADP-ribosylglycohydrolase family protein [Deltaproteobacteria bacterium]
MLPLGSRLRGGVLGLLLADAVGVPYEFNAPERLPPRDRIELVPPEGFSFRRAHARVPPGTWSDDGAQALCLLDSLLACGRLDLPDLGGRIVRWLDEGYLAVDADIFDVGIQTREAIDALRAGRPAHTTGPAGERKNGNGSLMRALPLALWHRGSDAELVHDAMAQGLPTHGHLRSQLCCALYCVWARLLLLTEEPDLEDAWSRAVAIVRAETLEVEGAPAELMGPLGADRPPGGQGSGYVVDALHSARLALEEGGGYRGVVQAAIALGNDTDTTACIAGGIAGIVHGFEALPGDWLAQLRGREFCDPLIEKLVAVRGRA